MTKIYGPNDPRSRMIPMTRSSSIPRSTLHKYVPWNLVHSLHQCSARSPEITLAAIVAAQDLWTGIMQSSTRHLQHGIIRCHDLREAEVNQLQAILAMAINMALLNSHHQREMGWPWWLPLQDTSLIYIYIYYTYIIHILYIYYTYIIHLLYIIYIYISLYYHLLKFTVTFHTSLGSETVCMLVLVPQKRATSNRWPPLTLAQGGSRWWAECPDLRCHTSSSPTSDPGAQYCDCASSWWLGASASWHPPRSPHSRPRRETCWNSGHSCSWSFVING